MAPTKNHYDLAASAAAHVGPVEDIDFSSGSKQIATVGNGCLKLWTIDSNRLKWPSCISGLALDYVVVIPVTDSNANHCDHSPIPFVAMSHFSFLLLFKGLTYDSDPSPYLMD
ncbi:uncharacterized protein LACBIDRAFT_335149 [Laccaria bicolor S238N-H82]|uniref:Predicted protein n=1 Tax=Laccaria bicolor (strain S238N-H82 / ATCC MYA-4686) TaxID=486041 RepID=B0E1I7_LACBS|nr:uncharacterized protein LACBIDRAFT_335149 [Laccaria bicolor S238N-H82]EDQ99315.1 predicted protein [Laccaria bicolor S238N-H82]|eukprot:XP_001890035.1 predicted protein [Laccaria bicolor S238N-H82]